jgi:hypothetical protein
VLDRLAILCTLLSLLLFSCKRELSCENRACQIVYDDGKARYSLHDQNGNCFKITVVGDYSEGRPLVDSNKVKLTVLVLKKGDYNIETPTIDGFKFHQKGRFADTGIHEILLEGTGKPSAGGKFHFNLPNTDCGWDVHVDSLVVVESYFYDFLLDGVRQQLSVSSKSQIRNLYDGGDKIVLWSILSDKPTIKNNSGTNAVTGLVIGKGSILKSDLSVSGLNSFFAPSPYSFSAPFDVNNISISWIDDPSDPLSSNALPGLQTGSMFVINHVSAYVDSAGNAIARVKAHFACLLYSRTGAKHELSNGTFYGEFANILR